MAKYYIFYNGQQIGPMDKEVLLNYGLTPNSLVWTEGLPEWVAAVTIPELMALLGPQQPPQQQFFSNQQQGQPYAGQPQYNSQPYNQAPYNQPPYGQPGPQGYAPDTKTCDKDKVVFGILALLIGTLGIQYFYVGKTTAGIITILLTLVTCGLWGFVVFIQGIVVLVNSQQDFERKFVYSNSTFPIF